MSAVNDSYEPEEVALEYYARLKMRAEIYWPYFPKMHAVFPKHSYARGIQGIARLIMDVVPIYKSLAHDVATFNFYVQGNTVIAESASRGTLTEAAGGGSWSETEGGRFCQVFECSGGKITCLHYYLDPDYTGRDTARYPWLTDA